MTYHPIPIDRQLLHSLPPPASSVLDVTADTVSAVLVTFIAETRPRWAQPRRDDWVATMTERLWRAATNAA